MGKMSDIWAVVMVFSFISIIYMFIAVMQIGITNDYILYNVQAVVDNLGNQSILGNNTVAYLQTVGDTYTSFNFHLDDVWFLVYVMFIITSFITAYQARGNNYFTFLGMLFYGTMFLMFILTIFTTLTEWFRDEVLLALLPTVSLVIPKFYFYLDNIGIISLIHIVACLIINMVDFDFAKIFAKKKQEQNALEDEEVV